MSLSDQLKFINGQAILIESNRSGNKGKYIDAHDSKTARVTACAEDKRWEADWTKWILHHIKDDIIVLESARYKGHYLDMNTDKTEGDRHVQRLTFSDEIPAGASWALFKVWGTTLDNVAFQSLRWRNRWLDAHESGKLLGALGPESTIVGGDWSRFKILSNRGEEFEFQTALTNFDFDRISDIFDASKKPMLYSGSANAEAEGFETEVTLGKEYVDKFEFGFDQEISTGTEIETEVEFGIPFILSSKTTAKVSSSIKLGSHQNVTQSSTIAFEKKIAFKPKKLGRYKLYMIVWEVQDAKVPFTAEYTVSAREKSTRKPVAASVIDSYVKSKNHDSLKMVKDGAGSVTYKVSGEMKASLAITVNEGVVPEDKWAAELERLGL